MIIKDFESEITYKETDYPDFFSSPFSYIENMFDSAVDTVEDVIYTVGEGLENIRNRFDHSEESITKEHPFNGPHSFDFHFKNRPRYTIIKKLIDVLAP